MDALVDLVKAAIDAVKAAAEAAKKLANAMVEYVKNEVGGMFSAVVDPIVEGLKEWAEGIQDAMENFFEELAKWNTVDGDESVDATMQAGTALMMSFIGKQDKAESVMNIMQDVMSFIEPFQKYISPFGAVSVIANSGILNGDATGMGSFFNEMIDNAGEKLGDTVNYLVNMVFGDNGMFSVLGLSEQSMNIGLPNISFKSLKNFAQASGIYEGQIKLLIDIACSINTAEIANWATNGLLVAFSLISLSGFIGGITTTSATVAMIGEVASLALTITGIIIDSAMIALGAFFWTLINCFVALVANAIENNMPGIILKGGVFILDMASLVTYAASKS